jgi:Coenzyme PQQ synthesis protein D (PqqD)
MSDYTAGADLLPHGNIHSFPLGDELILFDEPSKHLFRSNPTASLIWQGWRAGFSREEIIAILSQQTGATAEQIAADVNDVISQWHAVGFLNKNPKSPAAELQTPAVDQPVDIIDSSELVPQLPSHSPEYKFRILDTCFRLKVPTEKVLRLMVPMLSHLAVSYGTQYAVPLSIVRINDRYYLLHDKKIVDWCAHLNGIGPMLHGNAVVIAYENSHRLLGLHAAAVYYQGKCILMPAPSGSGKSTLTAALVGSGFSHCADDLVLLTPAPVYMRPVPVAVGLKTGSWNLLASYHPNLALLPTHLRSDGKQVRYLVPPADTGTTIPAHPLPIDYIVFPQFLNDGNKAVLAEIGSAEGLCRLTEAGYEMQDDMTADSVRQLVDWIKNVPCYSMHFNQLDDAVSVILSLLS